MKACISSMWMEKPFSRIHDSWHLKILSSKSIAFADTALDFDEHLAKIFNKVV